MRVSTAVRACSVSWMKCRIATEQQGDGLGQVQGGGELGVGVDRFRLAQVCLYIRKPSEDLHVGHVETTRRTSARLLRQADNLVILTKSPLCGACISSPAPR